MTTALDTATAPDRAAPAARSRVSRTDLWLLLTTVIWGSNYSVVKYGTDRMDALAFNGARILMATLAFVVLAAVHHRRPGARRVSRRDALLLLALGVLGNCVYQTLFAEGVAHTRAGSAALLLAASPAMIAVIGRWLGIERIGARGYAGVALSMLGIALVVGQSGHDTIGESLTGDAIVLAAAVCWAWYTVLLKPLADRVSLIDVSALTLVGGMIPLLAISAPSFAATAWRSVTPVMWGAMAFAGIGSLVIGYLGWYRGVRVLGPTHTAVFSNLQPVVALGVAWMMLNEHPTMWQGAGAVTIIAGVVLTRA